MPANRADEIKDTNHSIGQLHGDALRLVPTVLALVFPAKIEALVFVLRVANMNFAGLRFLTGIPDVRTGGAIFFQRLRQLRMNQGQDFAGRAFLIPPAVPV